MKSSVLLSSIFVSLLACRSIPLNEQRSSLEAFDQVSLGASKEDVIRILGIPNETGSKNGFTKLTYFYEYKGRQIPKVIVWTTNDGNTVSEKMINLFEETNDVLKISDFEKRYGKMKFSLSQEAVNPRAHYVPSKNLLTSEDKGVSLKLSGRDRNEIQTMSWSVSEKSRSEASVPQ